MQSFLGLRLDDDFIEDGGVIGVDRDKLFGVEGHGGFAALGEGDQLACAGAQVMIPLLSMCAPASVGPDSRISDPVADSSVPDATVVDL